MEREEKYCKIPEIMVRYIHNEVSKWRTYTLCRVCAKTTENSVLLWFPSGVFVKIRFAHVI